MALTVNTNVAALGAQRNLEKSQSALNTSFQRLSSGLRINSAKDDAAGLAISNGFTASIQALTVASRNANDGVSIVQTTEGALSETNSLLLRLRELAVQSSNDTNTASDRANLQTEAAALISEIDRIATSTDFNGKNLLDGSFGTSSFQIGTDAGESISLTIDSAKTSALGSTSSTQTGEFKLAKKTSTAGSLTTSGGLATLTTGQLTINGTAIRAADSGDDTVSTSDNAASAIARAAAINASTAETGVTAVANATTLDLGAVTVATGTLSGDDFTINGVNVAMSDTNTLATIISDINAVSATSGVAASGSAGGLTLTAIDGRNIQITSSGDGGDDLFANFDVTAADDDTQSGTITLYSNDDIVIGGTSPATVGTGLGAQTINANNEKVLQSTNGASTFEDLSTGDLIINGYSVNMSATTATSATERSQTDGSASAMNIALMINNTTGLKDEVVADAQTVMNLGKVEAADASGSFALTINGQAITIDQAILENDSDGYLQAEINNALSTGVTTDDLDGIYASVNDDGELLLTADDGRNITVNVTGANTTDLLANIDVTTTNTNVTGKGSITLSGVGTNTVDTIEGDKKALAGIVSELGKVSGIDVSTKAGAQSAITTIDAALSQVDTRRADLGAVQSRLESIISVNSLVKENLSAANSRILDADFAAETSALTKNQILQQAGLSVLAQANQSPQSVLALLQ